MEYFNISIGVSTDMVQALFSQDHVSPAIMETKLKSLLDNMIGTQVPGFRVNFVEYTGTDGGPYIESKRTTLGMTHPITDKHGYRDDYPNLVSDEWETMMVAKGHNVTSHINEQGPCSACGIGETPLMDGQRTQVQRKIDPVDAYFLGQQHCLRFMQKCINPLTQEQFSSVYYDPVYGLYNEYKRGYNEKTKDLLD